MNPSQDISKENKENEGQSQFLNKKELHNQQMQGIKQYIDNKLGVNGPRRTRIMTNKKLEHEYKLMCDN